jgi:hypothetical protein
MTSRQGQCCIGSKDKVPWQLGAGRPRAGESFPDEKEARLS